MSTVLATFYSNLNKLKLDQFPCGTGSWRQEAYPDYLGKGDANHETLLALEELAHSDVFSVTSDWSEDTHTLRQLAVHKPDIISEAFIFHHFKSLRLINRNINEVDRGLLKFTQLHELSLTGNCLSSIRGANLPRSLTVLQLFANKFTDLQELAIEPPPGLQHLGAGYNNLHDITSYISPLIWPNLLSLDLSYNKLGNVRETLDCLAEVSTLRNLSLIANPITLAPGYNGYTLDVISQLQILDDVSISDDDRLHFTHISRVPVNWDEAVFLITFPSLANLRAPPPNELVEESAGYFPLQKTYTYCIRFFFFSTSDSAEETSRPVTVNSVTSPSIPLTSQIMGMTSHVTGMTSHVTGVTSHVTSATVQTQSIQPSLVSGSLIQLADTDDQQVLEVTKEETRDTLYETEDLSWVDNLAFEQPVIVRCSDLPTLSTFLGQTIQFTVVEKVVESFTTIAPPEPTTPTPPPSSKGKKGGKDNKEKKKKEDSILKDKEGNILKWVSGAPTYNEIAHITADISQLLTKTETSEATQCIVTEKPPVSTPVLDDGRMSSCSVRGAKGKGVKGKKKAVTPVNNTPPEPLKLHYKIERVTWDHVDQCRAWAQSG